MPQPGMKIGPKDWKERLQEADATYCEVWYRVDQETNYREMFRYLREQNINTGLHFWGVLENNIMPNLAYPDKAIWEPSLELMKRNLKTASAYGFAYVNIHLGNLSLATMFLDAQRTEPIPNSLVSLDQAIQTFTEQIQVLNDYAQKLHILLLVETVPPFDPENWFDPTARLRPHATHPLPSTVLEELAKNYGILVNNDISHTAAEFSAKGPTTDRAALWKFLRDRTAALAPYTKLLHCNTMVPPFNGTDSHDGILDDDFAKNVFPTKPQLLELFSLFKHRNDVWIVNEPKDRHVENYHALRTLLGSMS